MAVIGDSHLGYLDLLSIYLDCKVLLLRCTIAEGPLAEKPHSQAMNIVANGDVMAHVCHWIPRLDSDRIGFA